MPRRFPWSFVLAFLAGGGAGFTAAALLAGGFGALVWGDEEVRRAENSLAAGHFGRAEGEALVFLRQHPNHPRATLIAARAAIANEHFESAIPLFWKYRGLAGALEGTDLHAMGKGFIDRTRYREAYEVYEVLLAQDPNDFLAMSRLAALKVQSRRYDEAKVLCEKLAAQPEYAAYAHAFMGEVHLANSNYPGALASFEKLIAGNPALEGLALPAFLIRTHLGRCYMAQGKVPDAISQLTRAVSEGGDAETHFYLGKAYEFENQTAKAVEAWSNAIRLDAGHWESMIELGNIARAATQVAQALEWGRKALATVPDEIKVHYFLAETYRQAGEVEKAESHRITMERLRRLQK